MCSYHLVEEVASWLLGLVLLHLHALQDCGCSPTTCRENVFGLLAKLVKLAAKRVELAVVLIALCFNPLIVS